MSCEWNCRCAYCERQYRNDLAANSFDPDEPSLAEQRDRDRSDHADTVVVPGLRA